MRVAMGMGRRADAAGAPEARWEPAPGGPAAPEEAEAAEDAGDA